MATPGRFQGSERDRAGRSVDVCVDRIPGCDPEVPIIIAEGEKAAAALLDAGFTAVGTVTGASSTLDTEALEVLRDREVILWPDADDAGTLT